MSDEEQMDDDIDLSALSDEELVEQMHDDLYDGLKEEIEEGPFLLHNEPIWLGDEIVGFVTSGAWGFRVGRSLGLASLYREEGVSRRWIQENQFEVEIALRRYPLEVRLKPFYDPQGGLLRG